MENQTAAEGIKAYFEGLSASSSVLFSLPFALLLISFALIPILFPHLWGKHWYKSVISLVAGVPVAGFFIYKDWHTLANTGLDYGTFICLLGALFVISGGIFIRGSYPPTPAVNISILIIGALLANVIGTTGASMLMIRPLLRVNTLRSRKIHIIVFFIFIVSNGAGLLTPLGDPPLFLGFLKGVPFTWTFNLWKEWLTLIGLLLAIFFVIERRQFARESDEIKKHIMSSARGDFGIDGLHNIILLGVVLSLIVISGSLIYPNAFGGRQVFGEPAGSVVSRVVQMFGMSLVALISHIFTNQGIRKANNFSVEPMLEVAVLFAGIFMAMIPVLLILEVRGASMNISHPSQYFWMAGGLSSVLDNAPTYLTFTSLAKGSLQLSGEGLHALAEDPFGAIALAAISCGAVFMGAVTYIGNGPNLMVKSIAENHDIKMPLFFGYLAWSFLVLIPIFLLITFLFF